MPANSDRSGTPQPHCKWCGQLMVDQPSRGRRKQYCSQACRQRAYEHRALKSRTARFEKNSEQSGTITLGPKAASNLKDLIFQLRCAAEDVETAAQEKADHEDIAVLAGELLRLARRIEKIRALGPSQT